MNTPDRLPVPSPTETPESAAFWQATSERRLIIQQCRSCSASVWYPRARCPDCGASELAWRSCDGRGTVYSHTVVTRGTGAFADVAEYVVAYVELFEGPRLLTNVVGCPASDVRIGMEVEAEFHPTESGAALVRFHPVGR